MTKADTLAGKHYSPTLASGFNTRFDARSKGRCAGRKFLLLLIPAGAAEDAGS